MSHTTFSKFTLSFLLGGLLVLSGCLKSDNTPPTGSGSVLNGSGSSVGQFFLSSSSMAGSGSDVMVFDLSSSSSSELLRGDAIGITQTPDRQEVQPGNDFMLSISIANKSSQVISGLQVESAFPVAKMTVLDPTSGSLDGDRITWTIDSLEPNQVRNIRFMGKANDTLAHGESILNIVTVRSDALPFPITSTQDIRIVQKLPRTGAGDFVSPLEDGSKFVTPLKK